MSTFFALLFSFLFLLLIKYHGYSFGAHVPQKQHQPAFSITPEYSTQPDSPLTCQDLVEHIPNLTELDNEQKADLAFMLLQDIPEPHRDAVIRRLRMNSQSRNHWRFYRRNLLLASFVIWM
ncbi:unnamed protein product [Absidia cylindrospora]